MSASFLPSRPTAAVAAAGPARPPAPLLAVLAALLALLAAPGVTSSIIDATSGLTSPITQAASGWSAASAEAPPGSTGPAAETRVRASTVADGTRVGSETAVDAGLHPGPTVSYDQIASGWLVAPRPTGLADELPALTAGTGTRANHHIFPQQFRERFAQAGIDIDDFTVGVDHPWEHLRGIHGRGVPTQGMPGRWNQRWAEFFRASPDASAREIYQFGGSLMDEFGLSGRPIVPYK